VRILILSLLFVVGCVSTGPNSGVSVEAEGHLPAVGPAFNEEFSLDGSSLSLESNRRLIVVARSDSFASLGATKQSERAREMADWLWKEYGNDANLRSIRIRPVKSGAEATDSDPWYNFDREMLDS